MDSIPRQFATNLEGKKADEQKLSFDIATVIEEGKIDELIAILSPTPYVDFPMQTFPDKSKKNGVQKRYC